MRFKGIFALVTGCVLLAPWVARGQWTPPTEMGRDKLVALSDELLAMPDIPIREDLDVTRIHALDMEWDIAGMVYQPQDGARIPTGPDGRKVGIFILHGGSGDYRAREDIARLLAGKLGFKVVIMNYPGRLYLHDPSHRWPGDTMNPDGTVRLPIWHRDRPITHDQYTVTTNRDEDIQRRYGTVFLACAKNQTEFYDRMAAWPVAFEDGGKELMRRHLPDGEYSIYIHGHSTGGPFSFMFTQRVPNIVGVVGIENTPFGYLHGEMMTKKLGISPTWDIPFNCLRIRTWRDTTRHLGAEALDKQGPEALLQLGRLMDHVFDTWDKAKSHAQFKAESTIHFNGLGPLIDGARAAARRLNLSVEETERLVGRFVGYTRELVGRGVKPVPPALLLIARTSPDHRMEYYQDIYLPMFAAMDPAPKVHVVQLDMGTHFYSDPEEGLPRGVGAAVAKVWHDAIMGGYYVKDAKQSNGGGAER